MKFGCFWSHVIGVTRQGEVYSSISGSCLIALNHLILKDICPSHYFMMLEILQNEFWDMIDVSFLKSFSKPISG